MPKYFIVTFMNFPRGFDKEAHLSIVTKVFWFGGCLQNQWASEKLKVAVGP
jgi:hypothetical protein